MSKDNVESIRAILDAYSRGDFDVVQETAYPEIVVVPPGWQAPIDGSDSVRRWMEPDAFESQLIEPLEFRVAGNRVLVRQRSKIRGAGSGIRIDFLAWVVWTFNDEGLTTRVEIYGEHEKAKALEAAGLPPE